ncbi:trypsin-like peptidase domain-containing protein [Glycomyces mayteni]|uniref:Trypsin-like peptidase domain-containing protein n=1 Tax=Glycomyces mayteni TaxID=543887 RepID=A0ABW2D8F8_9ACTN
MLRINRGCGILLSKDYALTCAHVIDPTSPAKAPDAPVSIRFPGIPRGAPVAAAVHPKGWKPIGADESGDICVLRIDGALPVQARPAPLRVVAAKQDRDVKAHGFPDDLPEGVWASAVTQGRTGPGGEWIQLRGETLVGKPITGGFSGAGVMDVRTKAVIGMVIRERVDAMTQTAFMMSLETIAEYWPKLDDLLDEAGRSDEQVKTLQAALVEAGKESQKLRERLEKAEASLRARADQRKPLKKREKARARFVDRYRQFSWWDLSDTLDDEEVYDEAAVDEFKAHMHLLVQTDDIDGLRNFAFSKHKRRREFPLIDRKKQRAAYERDYGTDEYVWYRGYECEYFDPCIQQLRLLITSYLDDIDFS